MATQSTGGFVEVIGSVVEGSVGSVGVVTGSVVGTIVVSVTGGVVVVGSFSQHPGLSKQSKLSTHPF